MTADGWSGRLLVVGTGLIGTSIGLAVGRAGGSVLLSDTDVDRLELAASLGAGVPTDPKHTDDIDLVVIATPPAFIGSIAAGYLRSGIGSTITHVGSVQTKPQLEVEAAVETAPRFVGGHPIAGRERSGPAGADPDLFRDRPWIICPTPSSASDAVEAVTSLARACGADTVRIDAREHDGLFARLSHVPQLVSSSLAASLVGLAADEVALAGPGIRDTTRLADSDPDLWEQVVAANAAPVAHALRAVAEPLLALAGALEKAATDEAAARLVHELLVRGREGRSRLPGKHGGARTALAVLQVVVPDEPGALARLLTEVAAQRVNLEDLRVEHASGHRLGVAEVVVPPTAAGGLASALRAGGWTVIGGGELAL